MNTVIIDDDEMVRKTLKLLLKEYCPDLNVTAEAGTYHDAVRCIYEEKPSLVFMDVQLSDSTGFEVLNVFDAHSFVVIMMSSHREYALQAFDYDSKGYLLKPFETDQLFKAVERARVKLQLLQEASAYRTITEEQTRNLVTILVKSTRGNVNVYYSDIVACSAHYGYTRILLQNRSYILSMDTLNDWEQWLSDEQFIKIHRSHIINLRHVAQWQHEGKEGIVQLSTGDMMTIARTHKADFIRKLNDSFPIG